MTSKDIFALRNEAKSLSGQSKHCKLTDALTMARRLYSVNRYDEWNQKALAYVLIDLCKYHIADRNIDQSSRYFQELTTIEFDEEDEIIEGQKKILRPKIDSNYAAIQQAEELSKSGKHQEAITIFKRLISENKLADLHHEAYGWTIYRLIKADVANLSSLEIRTFLRDYMNLKNERPSMLHSTVLNFALSYSKTHADFKFYNFFLLWDPQNLRDEDLHNGYKDGQSIPSLISRVCRDFVNTNTVFDIEDVLLRKVGLGREAVIDLFREAYFWNIFHTHKDGKLNDLWSLFEQYNSHYSKYGSSKWHSEILNLAERLMKETDEWRFLNFFKDWNPDTLRDQDWKETKKDDHTFKPLAIKSIKKAYETIKKQTSQQDLSWIIKLYEKAIKLFPDDEWLLREKALLHIKQDELEAAITIYRELVLELPDKHYIWQEFAGCVAGDISLRIGMLSKALSLEMNEDFLGDIHLDLAKALIDEGHLENALVELNTYRKHRELKGWRLSLIFDHLAQQTKAVEKLDKDNWELYRKYIRIAESFAYSEIEWTEVVLVDKWKDENEKERLTFTDGKAVQFSIGKKRFDVVRNPTVGQIFKFKLHKVEIKKEVRQSFFLINKNTSKEYKYTPVLVEESGKELWDILDDTFAVVDYVNTEKNIVHAITFKDQEVFFPQMKDALQVGEFVKAKHFVRKVKDESRHELRRIEKIDKDLGMTKFRSHIAVVDGVNEQKQLFHFVISSKLQGVAKYTETNLRPIEGQFIIVCVAKKIDKEKRLRLRILNITLTEEENEALRKDISGNLEIKYKGKKYEQYFDYAEEETGENAGVRTSAFPDFAFIGDYYVPKHLLEKHKITTDCQVKARVILAGDKWRVMELEKL